MEVATLSPTSVAFVTKWSKDSTFGVKAALTAVIWNI